MPVEIGTGVRVGANVPKALSFLQRRDTALLQHVFLILRETDQQQRRHAVTNARIHSMARKPSSAVSQDVSAAPTLAAEVAPWP